MMICLEDTFGDRNEANVTDLMEAVMAVEMAEDAMEEVALVDIVIETETMTVTTRDSLVEEMAKMERIKS